MKEWRITDTEWEQTRRFLERHVQPNSRPGRPRLENTRAAAEASLYHHYHSLARGRSHSFGWNQLPANFGVSPATANRRFREWLASGAWTKFWDALLKMRNATNPSTRRTLSRVIPASTLGSPIRGVIEELERAFQFLNNRFFAGVLPANVVITFEQDHRGGYFCGQRWRLRRKAIHQIMVSTIPLMNGWESAFAVLLHEMVHLRNHSLGLLDASRSQYHNRHFRDAALLAGLDCVNYNKAKGYGMTQLGERGWLAAAEFRPANQEALAWFKELRIEAAVGTR